MGRDVLECHLRNRVAHTKPWFLGLCKVAEASLWVTVGVKEAVAHPTHPGYGDFDVIFCCLGSGLWRTWELSGEPGKSRGTRNGSDALADIKCPKDGRWWEDGAPHKQPCRMWAGDGEGTHSWGSMLYLSCEQSGFNNPNVTCYNN